jgi:protein-L-isoaspartate(D-aspartate) O-methyltransferase
MTDERLAAMDRLLAEYRRRLAKEAVLDVVQQYRSSVAQRLSDEAVLIARRTAIVERLHEREQQKRTMASEPDRPPHHHVHAADSGARNHLEFARPLNVMASAARSHVSHSSSRSWCGIDKRRSATMSGLTRIPDPRQTSGHVRKVPANLLMRNADVIRGKWPEHQEVAMRTEDLEALRERMLAVIAASAFGLRDTIGKSGFDERVMTAMGKVPRHEFVPIELQPYAYENIPLPIGFAKTISQPFVVALMTDLLDIKADDSVLEIGTGLGYQAAILAQLARKVYSVEIIEELGQAAKQRLRQQGCNNVELKIANGYHGWSEHAPFDKVIVTAAPDLIPPPLIHQLKAGGKMVIPAGLPNTQQLIVAEKLANGRMTMKEILSVRFSQLEGTEPGLS